MAIPKRIRFVTLDCYGTLVDWREGARRAFAAEAKRDGAKIDEGRVVEDFIAVQHELQGGSYELYAEVLRRTAVRCAAEQEWALEPSRSGFLPASVERWPPFPEAADCMARLGAKYRLGLLSNTDDRLLGLTRRHLKQDLDLVVTAQQVRTYKPEPAHFKECERRTGGRQGWVHVGASYETDVAPCLKLKIPVVWVNRLGEELGSKQKKPDATVATLSEAADLLRA